MLMLVSIENTSTSDLYLCNDPHDPHDVTP